MASDDWELHKKEISCLYLLEKLSLKDVLTHMKVKHNFDKKKHQYEYQFKKWGFKKNIDRDVWQYVGHRIQKRKRLGKKSEITLYGRKFPSEKLRKRVQRYTTIPTADDFRRGVLTPVSPGSDIVQIRTPRTPDFHHKWPETLPWFRFIKRFQIEKDHLKIPDLGEVLLTAGAASFQADIKTPLALYAKIHGLARSIPRNHEIDNGFPQSALWTDGPSAIAIESLKIILFSLANKCRNALDAFQLSSLKERDEFILRLFDRILESNLGWPIGVLGSNCSTSNAILEVVWGCAIRQKRYDVIEQLLKAGIATHMPVNNMFIQLPAIILRRGTIEMPLVPRKRLRADKPNGLESAVFQRDLRLAKLLLDNDANIKRRTSCFLEWSTFFLREGDVLELAKLLTGYILESDLLRALGIAIAKHYNRVATGWIDKLDKTQLTSYHFEESYWRWEPLMIDCTLLHIAIVSENTEIASILLETTLALPDLVSKKELKDLLMVACLAGDRSTIEQLVNLNVDWADRDWPGGVSPLVATAWNSDIGIAEMILQAGAFSDHDTGDYSQVTTSPLPIHVATRSGNTSFVKWLIDHERGLDTQFKPSYPNKYDWLVPSHFTTPLQMALESGNVSTVIECQHASLLGGELGMAIRLGDERVVANFLLRENDIISTSSGRAILDKAAEDGNRDTITWYFSLGGKYRSFALLKAVKASVISRDESIVLLLVRNRPIQTIDGCEASALVIAIREKRLHLLNILLAEPFLPSSKLSHYYRGQFDRGEFPVDDEFLFGGITPITAALISDTELAKMLFDAGYQARPLDLANLEDEHLLSRFCINFPPSHTDSDWTHHLLHKTIEFDMTQRSHECIMCTDNLEYYIDDKTPLQIAVECGNPSLVDLLIKNGANVNAPAWRDSGATALQLAAIKGNMDIARSLLQHEGDVNGPPAVVCGRTALEGASENGELDMVQLLLENGVMLDGAMRIQYIRAVAFARKEGHYAVATLLEEFGSWTDRDQQVCDREDILDDEGYFLFNDGTGDWFRHAWWAWKKSDDVDMSSCYRWSPFSIHSSDAGSTVNGSNDSDDEDTENYRDDEDDGLRDITQEQVDCHKSYTREGEDEDEWLSMKRYLKETCDYDVSSPEINEQEPWNWIYQNLDDDLRNLIQEEQYGEPIADLLDGDGVAEVADAAIDLDLVLEELLEGGGVEDLVAGGLRSVDDQLID
ncbi:ankyrin repeat-containing domain protein [Xylaria grammica]|nr:ankyrin repeat-containing domain protein [Xylaria grammica]